MANDLQKQVFRDRCFEALAEEGYRPSVKGDGIEFKVDYNPFFVEFDREKAFIFQMQTLQHYDAESLSHADALRLANQCNANFSDVKTTVIDAEFTLDYTIIMFRSECYIPNFFEVTFKEKITALQESVRLFSQQVLAEEISRLARLSK